MTNVWLDQGRGINTSWLKCAIKTRLQDQLVQEGETLSNNNNKCFLYRTIKQDHKMESYLVNLPKCFYVLFQS